MLRFPAEYVMCFRSVCDEVRGITGTPALHVHSNFSSGHRARCINDFQN